MFHPVSMEFAPDGRIFVCEQQGRLRIIKNGVLLPTPFLTLQVETFSERGLLGVTFDPGFETNQFVYVYYTARIPTVHNRLSRFVANGDVSVPGSEQVLIDFEELQAGFHNGGAIRFGPDKKLYVAVGDNVRPTSAQAMNTYLGKVLRINGDGTIPTDNPFYPTATNQYRAIWALGFRNPFSFAIQPGSGQIYIHDVGQLLFEEINHGVPGGNYGWPTCEGPCQPTNASYLDPLFFYGHNANDPTNNGCAITGGTFYNPLTNNFPSLYTGQYFFSDYCNGWIRMLNTNGSVSTFATGVQSPVDLDVSPEGYLYYLSYFDGSIYRVISTNSPAIIAHPTNKVAQVNKSNQFNVVASGALPLHYQWQQNGTNISGAVSNTLYFPNVSFDQDGSTYQCIISNNFGSVTSNPALLLVTTNRFPVPTILSPSNGAFYSAGELLSFSGTALDPDEGVLSSNHFSWSIVFHHETHTHPFLGPLNSVSGGTAVIPDEGEDSTNVWYRIYLTVTDSDGAQGTTFVDIRPRLSVITLTTSPPNFDLLWDGRQVTTSTSIVSIVGLKHSISAVIPQTRGGQLYDFVQWSDGGALEHSITAPGASTTYTAIYTLATPPPVITEQPKSQMLLQGTNVTFTANVQAQPPFRLQWLFNGSNTIPGANGTTLTISNINPAHSGSYTLLASNISGGVFSDAAVLTVLVPPTIVQQPQTLAVVKGGTTNLSVTATGQVALKYQWKFNGIDLPGQTNATLPLTNISTSQDGDYTVVVANQVLSLTNGPPSLLSGMVSYWKLDETNGLRLDSHGTNHLTPSNGVGVVTGKLARATRFFGANETKLIRPHNNQLGLGNDTPFTFSCWFYMNSKADHQGFVLKRSTIDATTTEYQLYYNVDLRQMRFGISDGFNVGHAEGVTLGEPALYTWYFAAFWHDPTNDTINLQINNGPVETSPWPYGTLSTTSPFTLGQTIPNAFYLDGAIDGVGFWRRVLTDAERAALYNFGAGLDYPFEGSTPTVVDYGCVTSTVAKVTVLMPPSITTQPQSRTVMAGTDVTLNVAALGTQPLAYQWRQNGSPVPGGTNATLQLVKAQPNQSGSYSVLITNIAGSVTSSLATVAVNLLNVTNNTTPGGAAASGMALLFDGVDDYVNIPTTAVLDISSPITVEAWIRRRSVGVQHSVVEKYGCQGSAATVGGWALRVGADNRLGFFALEHCNSGVAVFGNTALMADTWYHVAGLWDGGFLQVYLNGNLDGSLATAGGPKPGVTPVRIGGRGNDTGTPFDGIIDEVRIWNVARTASQIQTDRARVLTGTESGLAAYWRLEEGSGLVAGDTRGNSSPGTLVNGPVWIVPPSGAVSGTLITRTDPATNVWLTTAELNGFIDAGGEPSMASFQWGTTTNYSNVRLYQYYSSPGVVVETLSGLTPGTTYFFRLTAYTSNGKTNVGANLSFTTPSPPIVQTQPAQNVIGTKATLHGTADPKGMASFAYFRWWTSPGSDRFTATQNIGSGLSPIALTNLLIGLTAGTTYSYQMVAYNAAGTNAGNVQSFFTPLPPTVLEQGTSNVVARGATLIGTINPNGSPTSAYFEWGTDNLTNRTAISSLPASADPLPIAVALQNLVPQRTYYYRLVAYNSGGTNNSSEAAFTTPELPLVAVEALDSEAAEQDQDRAKVKFTRSGGLDGPLIIQYSLGGSAVSGSDYTTLPGLISLPAGVNEAELDIIPLDDSAPEMTESVQITLRTDPAYDIHPAKGSATATIVDNDLPELSILDGSGAEGNAQATNVVLKVILSAAISREVTINYASSNGLAVAGIDFHPTNGNLTFPPGSTNQPILIRTIPDLSSESNETFQVMLSAPVNSTLARAQATATILNDDSLPAIAVTDTNLVEGKLGNTNALFRISLSGATEMTVSLDYFIREGSATPFTDYIPVSGTLVFLPGMSNSTVSVPVVGDKLYESNETFFVVCTNAVNAVYARQTGIGTIVNDDLPPPPPPGPGTALLFDGTNDFVDVPDQPQIRFTGPFALEAWVYRARMGVQHSIVEKYGCSGMGGYILRVRSDDRLMFGTRDDCNQGVSVLGNTQLRSNTWYHVAGVWDGLTLTIYLNGVVDGAAASTRPPRSGITPLRIGVRGNDFGTPFEGVLDEIRLWNGARTQTQLGTNMNRRLTGKETGLAGYYRFDDGQGLFTVDGATNNNTATLTNGPVWIYSTAPIVGSLLVRTDPPDSVNPTSAILAGMINSGNEPGLAFFEWGATTNVSNATEPQFVDGAVDVFVGETITGLSPGTTYYYRAVGFNGGAGTNYGATLSFRTPSPPETTTLAATNVTGPTARLQGTVNPNGGDTVAFFQWGIALVHENATPSQNMGQGISNRTLTFDLSGLQPGSAYRFRAVAYNQLGTNFGAEQIFTTPLPPLAETLPANAILVSSAGVNAEVNPRNGETTIAFEWGSTPAYGGRTPDRNIGGGGSAFIVNEVLSGLTPATDYHFRVVARNIGGTNFGQDRVFRTLVLPSVTTLTADSVTTNSASLHGSANANGEITFAYFEWGTNGSYENRTAPFAIGSGLTPQSLTAPLTGLAPDVTYQYRAVAYNLSGVTNYGAGENFTTIPQLIVTTIADSGRGSLRHAISNANVFGGGRITFDIPTADKTVTLSSPLPALQVSCDIDGTSQPGYVDTPLIQLNGNGAARGLLMTGGNSSVIGLGIKNINGAAITLQGGSNNQVRASVIASNAVGVLINSSTGNLVTTNIISQNSSNGIHVLSGERNSLLGNIISSSSKHSILLGLTRAANDGGDADLGPNGLQNYPIITSISPEGVVLGTLNSTPAQEFHIEFFGNETCHSSGFGEGETFLGSTNVTTDLTGVASFEIALDVPPGKRYLTCTATDTEGNTSPFGPCTQMPGAPLAVTTAPENISLDSGTMTGIVYPNNAPTYCYFEWGTSDSYGNFTAPILAGAGTNSAIANEPLTNLTTGVTYVYRLVASNALGVSLGANQSLVPLSPKPPQMAVQFDGVDDYINVPGYTNLNLTGPFTLEAWIRRDTINAQHSIIERYGCSGLGGYILRVRADNKILFGTRDDCVAGVSVAGGTSLAANTWYHVAGVWDGFTLSIYLNGALDGALPSTRPPRPGNTPLRIGARGNDLATPFQGIIDEVRVWNIPRSVDDLRGSMNQRLNGTESGLAGYWRLDEGSGVVAENSSPLNNPGQLINGPTWIVSTAPLVIIPAVRTDPATSISLGSATLNGVFNPRGELTYGYFEWGTNSSYGQTTSPKYYGSGTNGSAGWTTISSLLNGTTYHFRAVAFNASGATNRGAELTFNTPGAPGVLTQGATALAGTTATLNGQVNPNGLPTVVHFRWGTTTNYGNSMPMQDIAAGFGQLPVFAALSGLVAGQTYVYQIVAENAAGSQSGSPSSFTTILPPAVTTQPAQDIGGSSASLAATVNPNGAGTTVYFEWGLPGSRTNRTGSQTVAAGFAPLPVSSALGGLEPNTTYEFVAIAFNAGGTNIATPLNFTTPAVPVVSVFASIPGASETAGNNGQFLFRRTGSLSSPLTALYAMSGSAASGLDYITLSGTITIPAGSDNATLALVPIDDSLVESLETVILTLRTNAAYAVHSVSNAASIAITNNDFVTLTINDPAVTEGNAGTVSATFNLILSAALPQAARVDFASSNVTAVAGTDYVSTNGTVVFAAGVRTQSVAVRINGDLLNEASETFQLVLSNPSNAILAKAIGTGTIVNDDPLPSLTIADLSMNEGNAGATTAVFNVFLSAPSGRPVDVVYATSNSTAIAGSDFLGTNSLLTFPPGTTNRTINVTVNGDTTFEGSELFTVVLSRATNATIARAVAVCSLLNDDTPAPPSPGTATALLYDGVDDHVNVGGTGSASINAGGPITIEAWIYRNAMGVQHGIVEKYGCRGAAPSVGGFAFRVGADNRLTFWTLDDCAIGVPVMGGTILRDTTWYHVAAVWDGGQSRVYVNGVLDGVVDTSRGPRPGVTPIRIGARGNDVAMPFNGVIDEVRIWAVARTAPEIFNNRGRTLLGSEPGLACYWRFDEGDGLSAGDASGNGNLGSLINGPTWITSTAPLTYAALPSEPLPEPDYETIPFMSILSDPVAMNVQVIISGATAEFYVLEYSQDLLNWEELAILTNTTGELRYDDPVSGTSSRFYRVREVPPVID